MRPATFVCACLTARCRPRVPCVRYSNAAADTSDAHGRKARSARAQRVQYSTVRALPAGRDCSWWWATPCCACAASFVRGSRTCVQRSDRVRACGYSTCRAAGTVHATHHRGGGQLPCQFATSKAMLASAVTTRGGGGAGAIKNGKINSVLAAAACGQPRRGRSTSVYVPSRLLCLESKRWGHCDNQL